MRYSLEAAGGAQETALCLGLIGCIQALKLLSNRAQDNSNSIKGIAYGVLPDQSYSSRLAGAQPDSDGVEEILGEVAGLFLVDPNDCKPDLSQNF